MEKATAQEARKFAKLSNFIEFTANSRPVAFRIPCVYVWLDGPVQFRPITALSRKHKSLWLAAVAAKHPSNALNNQIKASKFLLLLLCVVLLRSVHAISGSLSQVSGKQHLDRLERECNFRSVPENILILKQI